MRAQQIAVLKFGGSVLRDAAALDGAVHEIHRRVRAGWRVIAVVSAFGGRTDRLLRLAERLCAGADSSARAALVSTGERQAAAALALALDASGLEARVLEERDLALVAGGPRHEATPIGLDPAPVHAALAGAAVVVVPGFVALGRDGQPVLLGRGGSDLTALFLSHRLGAGQCVLMKDVPGWFERDPARDPHARRFRTLAFEDAVQRRDPVVQPRAVRFAQRVGQPFRVAALGSDEHTRVGPGPTRLAHSRPPSPPPARVVLLGAGAVGGALLRLLLADPRAFTVTRVLARDPGKERPPFLDADLLCFDADRVLDVEHDVVVDALAGSEPSRGLLREALRRGSHAVTANKEVLVDHGRELTRVAHRAGVLLGASACVGGGIPMLETVAYLARRGGVQRLRAVLNGTSGFVLDRVREGGSLGAALRLARRRGLAEVDAAADLSGLDAARKLVLLLRAAGLRDVALRDVRWSGIPRHASGASLRRGAGVPRLVASADLRAGAARVELARLDPKDPLALPGERCAVEVEPPDGQRVLLRGRGAGGRPTAEALLQDLLEVRRHRARSPGRLQEAAP